MLNKRTHILFDKETFTVLASIADREQKSIGELVRDAVYESYKDELSLTQKRQKVIDSILSLESVDVAPYKAADLIKEGRRFEN